MVIAILNSKPVDSSRAYISLFENYLLSKIPG